MPYIICEKCSHYWEVEGEEEFWVFYMCDECGSLLIYVESLAEYNRLTKKIPSALEKTHTGRMAEHYWGMWRAGKLISITGLLSIPLSLFLTLKGFTAAIAILVLGIALIPVSFRFMSASEERGMGWAKGYVGELVVINCLRRLPDDYVIFNDVHFPGSYGNIDHVVLGPTGLYVIETKYYNGNYIIKGDQWFRYDLDMREEKSPSAQAKRNAATLKEFLASEDIHVSWVNAIVAFLNNSYRIIEEDEFCRVMKPCMIPRYIEHNRLMLGDIKIKRIREVLEDCSSEVW
ncbi:nuclease-related domain-containing protein [Methanothermobacter wolfeii]|mgnify:CR=1 FL=1|uniref:NERD domain-containing protein n=1 Tax=Methanothermobacter wolfeii TaxID=145261 RepID=A0A9E7RUR4_METWO|nr:MULTISPECIES: nuclease-related domain-containing protein [Methanothermobacter]MDI6701577.1 nuclease-related domain-containing protein [Methanothermobacter wolfeii]NLM01918.1 NERD domain-containing protein [Methanothermobacter wolfeii]QHN06320.1 NERD domain-containing protein [Methanothermobacter sp. THM-1]UXH32523.1 NERD domain-containing protein [Methanothermobacter wolfeii]SCM57034.1 putative protein {ECO:0000313/EMBL:ADL58448,1} [Methanothermobacter wolfeii]